MKKTPLPLALSVSLMAALKGEPLPDDSGAPELKEPEAKGTEVPEVKEPATPSAPEPGAATLETAENPLIAHLTAENERLRAQLTAGAVEIAQLKSSIADHQAAEPVVCAALGRYVQNMAVALGGRAGSVEKLKSSQLAERANELWGEFSTRFPVGGKAHATADVASPPPGNTGPSTALPVKLAQLP